MCSHTDLFPDESGPTESQAALLMHDISGARGLLRSYKENRRYSCVLLFVVNLKSKPVLQKQRSQVLMH